MKNYNMPVIIEYDKNGYMAWCPSLQGCYTQGSSYEEAMANITDAIRLHIEDRAVQEEEIATSPVVSLSTIHVTI